MLLFAFDCCRIGVSSFLQYVCWLRAEKQVFTCGLICLDKKLATGAAVSVRIFHYWLHIMNSDGLLGPCPTLCHRADVVVPISAPISLQCFATQLTQFRNQLSNPQTQLNQLQASLNGSISSHASSCSVSSVSAPWVLDFGTKSEILWLRWLLADLGVSCDAPTSLLCDSHGFQSVA